MPHHGKARGLSALSFRLGQAKRRKREAVTITVEDAELIIQETKKILRKESIRVAMQKAREKLRSPDPKKAIAIRQPGSIMAPHQSIRPTIR